MSDVKVCGACGAKVEIRETTRYPFRDRQTVHCPKCKAELEKFNDCYDHEAILVDNIEKA